MTGDLIEVEQTEAEELASAMAGYGKTARDEPPVEEVVEPSELQEDPVPATPAIEAPPEPTVGNLAQELADLRERVKSTAGDADTVRRMHGQIGDINRTLKQLQAPAQAGDAPASDELAAALKEAEAVAQEYPELAGPLVKALKVSMARQAPAQAAPEDITERVTTEVTKIRQAEAIEALKEEHPDYETVRDTPEYKTWLSSKTPEFQNRFNTTWNPAVVAKGLTEFKDSLKARERKQTRLAAAVTPQGVPQQGKSSTLPDDAGFSVGYNKGRKRL